MASLNKPETVDEYIAGFPAETQRLLQDIRALIRATAPDATEKMGYGIPTYRLNGNLIHFGGYEHHIGLYPGSGAIEHFKGELGSFKTSKGTIQFPLSQPIPLDLIRRITEYRVEQSKSKQRAGG